MLCTLLNSHPAILCHHELFNPRGVFLALDHRGESLGLGTPAQRDRDPPGFLGRVWKASCGASHVGFKVTRGQAETVLPLLLRDASIAKIVLRRGNRLKTFVSYLVAERNDQWECYEGGATSAPPPRVRVEREALEAFSRANEEFYQALHDGLAVHGQRCIELSYETLHSQSEHQRTLAFLGLSPPYPRLSAASVKLGSRDLRGVIANFAELEADLRGTPYHAELHDVVG